MAKNIHEYLKETKIEGLDLNDKKYNSLKNTLSQKWDQKFEKQEKSIITKIMTLKIKKLNYILVGFTTCIICVFAFNIISTNFVNKNGERNVNVIAQAQENLKEKGQYQYLKEEINFNFQDYNGKTISQKHTQESWTNTENGDYRIKTIDESGNVIDEFASIDGKFYSCSDCIVQSNLVSDTFFVGDYNEDEGFPTDTPLEFPEIDLPTSQEIDEGFEIYTNVIKIKKEAIENDYSQDQVIEQLNDLNLDPQMIDDILREEIIFEDGKIIDNLVENEFFEFTEIAPGEEFDEELIQDFSGEDAISAEAFEIGEKFSQIYSLQNNADTNSTKQLLEKLENDEDITINRDVQWNGKKAYEISFQEDMFGVELESKIYIDNNTFEFLGSEEVSKEAGKEIFSFSQKVLESDSSDEFKFQINADKLEDTTSAISSIFEEGIEQN